MTSHPKHGTERKISRQLNIQRRSSTEDNSALIDTPNCPSAELLWPSCSAIRLDDSQRRFVDGFYDAIRECAVRHSNGSIKEPSSISFQQPNEAPTDDVHSYSVSFSQTEWESLYVEALYTIKHRIGRPDETDSSMTNELYDYVKLAFNISDSEHKRLMAKASQEKSPVVVLEVTVIEAKNLEAKDANGFSDPYCMLGIVSTPHDNAMKGTAEKMAKRRGTLAAVDLLPARYIKTTSVKNSTLNPVWHEKFRFDLADVNADCLHMDIWDHDDDVSVTDAARRLNQVKGFKGLGRYFKQIAQSARSPITESNPVTETLDDFLGTIDIPVATIPSTGMDVWLDLKGRSARSKVEGKIHIKLSLATREERGLPEDERQFETKQHCDLMLIFIGYELKRSKEHGGFWEGHLPSTAATILHQHAVQGDITDAQQSICWWMAMSRKFCEQPFDWSILITCLDELDSKWNREDVYKEEEFAIAEQFDILIQNSMHVMSHNLMRGQSTCTVDKLRGMLTCLKRLYETKLFKHCCQFKRELRSEIINAIKKASLEYYQQLQKVRRLKSLVNSEDFGSLISGYIEMLVKINTCLRMALQIYNAVFDEMMEIDFFSIVYRKMRALLIADICEDLSDLKQLVSESPIDENLLYSSEYQAVDPVLKLSLYLHNFDNLTSYLPERDLAKLDPFDCTTIFEAHFERWIAIFRYIAMSSVRAAVNADKIEQLCETDGNAKISWSAAETIHIFGQIVGVWQRLLDPGSNKAKSFILSITQIVCDTAVNYADLSQEKLKAAGYYDEVGQFDVTEQLCIVINDVEQVRKSLAPLPTALSFYQHSESSGNQILHEVVCSADKTIEAKLKQLANYVADKMRPDMKRFVFHLCWASGKALSEDVISELMNYLDNNLITLNCNLLRANFDRILFAIWVEVLEEFDEVLSRPDQELREANWMPERLLNALQILVEFVHAGGKGLPMTVISCPLYKDLHHQLKMILTPTPVLLEEYFASKVKHQLQVTETGYGLLTARVYYNHSAKLLTVEVLKAKHLLPQDANGLSDPYVTVELHPTHIFPEVQLKQTKVVKKTLNPTFNDSFTFEISEQQCNHPGACVLLTIMDHDVMSANDFAGEVFIGLSTATGEQHRQNSLLTITLPIMNSVQQSAISDRTKRRGLLDALAMKYDEPTTLEFVKKRHTIDCV